MACAYFENALAEEGVMSDQGVLNLVEDNQLLMADPSEEEIREAIFSCPVECGSGLDSFHGFFYSSCWDLIKSDILVATTAFFKGGSLSRHYSSTFLALIPKTEDPKEDDARSSGASSPESTGSVETSISSPVGGMSYPSLFSSRPTGYGSSQQSVSTANSMKRVKQGPSTSRFSNTTTGFPSTTYEGLGSPIREEPPLYTSSIMQRFEPFENPLAGQSFGSQDEEGTASENPQFGKALYDFTAGGDDELNLTAGEEVEIDYEVDGWFYVKKKRPGTDGRMAGLVSST
ncbi:uncharacterized protein LOC143859306 isoform X2 [Tasmannia lanceolata]|uniref:uncharacterized protein LOC143859306 isoform X2 n=1 Tax=Tasmannia lanceolata TaxID=3420 RepID=UPI0040640A85